MIAALSASRRLGVGAVLAALALGCGTSRETISLLPEGDRDAQVGGGGAGAGGATGAGGAASGGCASGACGSCLSHDDCQAPTPVCDFDERRCVQCTTNAHCPLGQVCPFEVHSCTPRCTTAADCAGTGRPICGTVSGICIECTGSETCPTARPFCALDTGTCVPCLVDADCASGRCHDRLCEG